jgi:hypothetical protein
MLLLIGLLQFEGQACYAIGWGIPPSLPEDVSEGSKTSCSLVCQFFPLLAAADLEGFGLMQSKAEAADYHKLLLSRLKEARERRSESLAKKRADRMASKASREADE